MANSSSRSRTNNSAMAMNRGQKIQAFCAAVQSSTDPHAVAHLLWIRSNKNVAPQQQSMGGGGEALPSSLPDAFGNEWAPILKLWLEIIELVQVVRRVALVNCPHIQLRLSKISWPVL